MNLMLAGKSFFPKSSQKHLFSPLEEGTTPHNQDIISVLPVATYVLNIQK